MHLNKIHVYAVSFRQGNKQYGSNVTRPFLKSWIDGEAVVVCSARLFLTSDSMYCHFFFLHNLKLIFKTFSVRKSQASPIVGAFQKAAFCFVFLHNYTDAEQCSWKHTILQSPFRSDFQIQIIQVLIGPDYFS